MRVPGRPAPGAAATRTSARPSVSVYSAVPDGSLPFLMYGSMALEASAPAGDKSAGSQPASACTARIGTESSGVADPQLRVHGVRQLRVADASVLPAIPHGNTHAATVMAGEKAAIMIAAAS